ncbi:MAG: hypothetical protein H8E42_05150 [Nitrospinae bacterium]|nr:hypothetical protein [Nitrospinota bacterium]
MKINVNDAQKIGSTLDAVNGRSSAFAITTHEEVLKIADEAEKLLEQKEIPNLMRVGISVTFRPSGPESASYRYSVNSTELTLQRGVGGTWFLVCVQQIKIFPKQVRIFNISISREVERKIIEKALKSFVVVGEEI